MNSNKLLTTAVVVGGVMTGIVTLDTSTYANSEFSIETFDATRHGRTNVNLNMRAGAGANHRILRTLPRNTNLTILSESNGWMRVRVGNEEGWVSTRYVIITNGNNNDSGGNVATTRNGRTNVNLNMRAGAGINHRILRILPRNTNLTILSESNGWMRVRVGNEEGWVSTRYVIITNGNNNDSGGNVATTRNGRTNVSLNMRAGAGINHRILRTLPRNTNLTILSESNGWMRVRVGNGEGWVSKRYVTITSGNNNFDNNSGDTWNIMGRFNITPISLANQGRYIDIVSEASARHGIPTPLIQRIIEVESNFRSNAISSAGARGLMQLMPATASGLGVTDPHNPRQNIDAGTKYLRQHLNYFNGDLVLALAAYNAGIGNVRRHGGVPPFRETINYIQRITGINVARSLLSEATLIDMPEFLDSDIER